MSEVRIYKGSVLVDPECWVVDATGDVEAEARLIAAAPELLGSLEDMLAVLEARGADGPAMDRARASIAKAKGD